MCESDHVHKMRLFLFFIFFKNCLKEPTCFRMIDLFDYSIHLAKWIWKKFLHLSLGSFFPPMRLIWIEIAAVIHLFVIEVCFDMYIVLLWNIFLVSTLD